MVEMLPHPASVPSPAPALRGERLLGLVPGVAGAATALMLARYALQGAGTVWTDTGRAFYVADPVLGWTLTERTWVWLGLDAVGAALAVLLGALALAVVRRRSARLAGAARWGLGAAGVVALAGLALPLWALASGTPPDGARLLLPTDVAATGSASEGEAVVLDDGPAGEYAVVAHESNALVAAISAGKETFEARFGPVTGRATFDPRDLAGQPIRIALAVDAASIDTGVALRTRAARADLAPDQHPELRFRLARLTSFGEAAGGGVAFAGEGAVELMGRTLPRPVTGSIKPLDASALTRLGLAQPRAYLVQATLTIPLAETPLDPKAFDAPEIPVTARFILTPAAAGPPDPT